MNFVIRKATIKDQPRIAQLIAESVRGLSRDDYSERQIEQSIKSVFGVDTDLILDNTYFVAIAGEEIIGCGGWSKRKTLFGLAVTRTVETRLSLTQRRMQRRFAHFLSLRIGRERESERRSLKLARQKRSPLAFDRQK